MASPDDFMYFLCHDCHKKLTYEDVFNTEIPVGSELEEENCVKCAIPNVQVEYDSLRNPLHKCKCGKIIFVYVPRLFSCFECESNYENMIYVISDVIQMNSFHIDAIRELPIFNKILNCNGFHNIKIDRSSVLEYINSVLR
jgi:hypothetical protein